MQYSGTAYISIFNAETIGIKTWPGDLPENYSVFLFSLIKT